MWKTNSSLNGTIHTLTNYMKWNQFWGETNISPTIRGDEVVLSRCRICHWRVTHACLLKRQNCPQCLTCNSPHTVKHFLLQSPKFDNIRVQYLSTTTMALSATTMADLFKVLPSYTIIQFHFWKLSISTNTFKPLDVDANLPKTFIIGAIWSVPCPRTKPNHFVVVIHCVITIRVFIH